MKIEIQTENKREITSPSKIAQLSLHTENYVPFRLSDFLPISKYSKKILKNVKFGLQVHIHIEIMLNGSDQPLAF